MFQHYEAFLASRGKSSSIDHLLPHYEKFSSQLKNLFLAKRDSLIYSLSLVESFKYWSMRNPEEKIVLLDLGCGAGLPALYAMTQNSIGRNVLLWGVDINPTNISHANENADALGIADRCVFSCRDISEVLEDESFLNGLQSKGQFILGSNPPYIPCPEAEESNFPLIAGGARGDKFVSAILKTKLSRPFLISLNWGSLTAPEQTSRSIESTGVPVYVYFQKVQFGQFTKQPALYSYLTNLREKGVISFSGTQAEYSHYTIVSTVLRVGA